MKQGVLLAGLSAALSSCSILFPIRGLEGDAVAVRDGADASGIDATDPMDVDAADPLDALDSATAPETVDPSDVVDAPSEPDVVDAACTPVTPPTLDDCAAIGPMASTPVIDGVLDCGIPLWAMPVVAWTGPGQLPPSVHASIAAAYRPDGLYVFVTVGGEGTVSAPAPSSLPPWCGDAVELFVDNDGMYASPPMYDDPGTIQIIVGAPAASSSSSTVSEVLRDSSDLGSWSGQFVSLRTSDGFVTEAFIAAADLGLTTWSLARGGSIGLDVSIDFGSADGQPTGCPRLGQFTIQLPDLNAANCDYASCDVLEFCNPTLQ